MNFTEELFGPGGMVGFATTQLIGQLTTEKRQRMAEGLKTWLRDEARKKARPDLILLIDEFGKRIDQMVADMDIQIVDGKPVVKAVGLGQDTLRALEQGTNWFDPCDGVVSVMISSLWES